MGECWDALWVIGMSRPEDDRQAGFPYSGWAQISEDRKQSTRHERARSGAGEWA